MVFLAGSPEFSRKALELAAGPVIDLTGVTEDRPETRLRAPFVEEDDEEGPAGGTIHLIAHPAAIALALFLRRLQRHDPSAAR